MSESTCLFVYVIRSLTSRFDKPQKKGFAVLMPSPPNSKLVPVTASARAAPGKYCVRRCRKMPIPCHTLMALLRHTLRPDNSDLKSMSFDRSRRLRVTLSLQIVTARFISDSSENCILPSHSLTESAVPSSKPCPSTGLPGSIS